MDYLAGVLGCGRIQIFLDLHPEKSGFLRFPDLLVRMSRKPPASRTCWFACRGSRRLPGLAGSHLAEAAGFPDLLIRMSRKPPASRTCWFASRGSRRLPGLADSHLAEVVSFPDLLRADPHLVPRSS